MSIRKQKDHLFIVLKDVAILLFISESSLMMLRRFNIIIIQSDPRHCRLSCTEKDWQAWRFGGIQTKGKYKGIVSQCSAGRDTENAEEELPLVSFCLHSPSHFSYAPHLIALLLM